MSRFEAGAQGMTETSIDAYIDIKSPYAYLAIADMRDIERDYQVTLNWLPYTLDIADYLGSAKVDTDGNVIEENRTPHQWRRVRYSYRNVRRYANLRGLTIRGTQKIWDSSLYNVGMLYAVDQGVTEAYVDIGYERFWRRELDIEDEAVIAAVLTEAGADAADFAAYAAGPGRAAHDRVRSDAEARGVFGVPTLILDDEIYWGREHISLVRLQLDEQGLARPGLSPDIDVTYARRG